MSHSFCGFCDPVDYSSPGYSAHGFSYTEILELPFRSPGDLPNPRIETVSPALAGGFFTTEPTGKVKERELLYRVRPWAPVMDVKSVIALGV